MVGKDEMMLALKIFSKACSKKVRAHMLRCDQAKDTRAMIDPKEDRILFFFIEHSYLCSDII
jgi:hypothetical protein